MKLNIEEFTQQGLRKAESKDLYNEEQSKNQCDEFPPEYYQYKLNGIVIHMGVADSGHYYSYIMDREKTGVSEEPQWYEFNDNQVRFFDPRDIASEAFGGEEKVD